MARRGGAVILRVVNGPMTGALFRLAAASTVVGRSPECTITVSDTSMSRRHFELALEGDVCRVVDLGSRNGLLVNGAAVLRAVVRPGDEIRAGEVVFRVESERVAPLEVFAGTPPTLSAEATAPAAGTLLANLRSTLLRDERLQLYALVDGAQAFELAFAARLMGHPLYTLFSGDLAPATAPVGPLLVPLGEPSGFLQRWVDGIGQHAGVLLESAADLDSLYAHLRHVFIATDEEGQEYFFRFYDPRVFRVFLPTCREEELREFFGPIDRWIAEADGVPGFATYALDNGRVVTGEIAADAR